MRRLIRTVLLFSLPILLIMSSIEYSLRTIPNDYFFKDYYLKNESENIQVLYLGNSHIYFGLDPTVSKFRAFNAAATSQTLDIDLEILQKYKNWKSLKAVIVPIDYISMYFRLENSMDSWRMKNYVLYYGFSSKKIVNHFELLNGKFATNSNRIKDYYFNGKSNVDCNNFGYGLSYDHAKSENINNTAISAANRHTINLNENKFISNFENNKKVVYQFIEFAKQNKAKIYFVSPPVSKKYMNLTDNDQLKNTTTFIENIVETNKGYSSYLNFMDSSDFENSDFFDGDHLNDVGAKKFTYKLDAYLKMVL